MLNTTRSGAIESAFLHSFQNEVVKDNNKSEAFSKIEKIRTQLKQDHNALEFQEHGAGSQVSKSNTRTVSSIAKNALSGPYQCRVMHRLVDFLKAENVLELGTSLGISALYLGSASKKANVISLEGDENVHKIATSLFRQEKMENIHAILGRFSDTLIPTLEKMENVDLVFIDGHHQKEATISYFETISKFCHENSVIIVDDIYWSSGMNEAWKLIQNKKEVTFSIDLFFCGLIFFRKIDQVQTQLKMRPDKLLFHL